jgi:hypothetical protein
MMPSLVFWPLTLPTLNLTVHSLKSKKRKKSPSKMRFLSTLASLLLIGVTSTAAQSECSTSISSSDNTIVQFAWYLQIFIERFYSSVQIDQSFISSLPGGSPSSYYNLQGLQQQNRLGISAVQQVGTKVPGFETPGCEFTFPRVSSGISYIQNAAKLEADVSGAFIGLTAYTQKPELAFLFSRLGGEHAAHAAWLGGYTGSNATVFPRNSTSLIPAYTPDHVLKSGNRPGQLGQYIHACARAPSGPNGQAVVIGNLGATLVAPSASSSLVAATSSATPSGPFASGVFSGSLATPASSTSVPGFTSSSGAGGGGSSSTPAS